MGIEVLLAAAARAGAGRGGLVMVRADPGFGVTTLLSSFAQVSPLPVRWRLGRAVEGPAVVLLDDLHLADDAVLERVHEVVEESALLVVTGRHLRVTPRRFALLDRLGTVVDLGPQPGPEDGTGGNPWLRARLGAADRAEQVTAWAVGLAGEQAWLLRWAALLDEPLSVEELAAVSGRSPETVLSGLDRLASTGLLDGPRLRYPLVRQDLAATSAGLRATAARSLARSGASPETVATQLAEAPVTARTVAWLLRTADLLSVRPTPEIRVLLERALAWLPPGHSAREPLRAALAEACLYSGQLVRARRLASTGTGVRIRVVLAEAALAEFDTEAALSALGPGPHTGRLAAVAAYAHLLAGDLAGSVAAVEAATPAVAEDPFVAVALLALRAVGLYLARDLAGALELLDQAAVLQESEVADPSLWLITRVLRGTVQDLQHSAESVRTLAECRPVAETLGAGWLAWHRTAFALALSNRGRWDDALAEVEEALAEPGDQHGMARPLHATAAFLALHRGDLALAREHLKRAEHAVCRGLAVFYDQNPLTAQAMLHDLAGETELALGLVRRLADGIGPHHAHAVTAVGPRLVRIAVTGGDLPLARRLLATVTEWPGDDSPGQRGAVLYCRGLVEADPELLLAAAEAYTEGGVPIAAARAAEDAAVLLAARGEADTARGPYRDALARYTDLNATGDLDRAAAALRAHGVRRGATGSRNRPKHGWASLTDAEHRVAELLAEGRSNREIAERLFVSVRTVHTHVSRVLAKLGCATRVEVAVGFRTRG